MVDKILATGRFAVSTVTAASAPVPSVIFPAPQASAQSHQTLADDPASASQDADEQASDTETQRTTSASVPTTSRKRARRQSGTEMIAIALEKIADAETQCSPLQRAALMVQEEEGLTDSEMLTGLEVLENERLATIYCSLKDGLRTEWLRRKMNLIHNQ